VRDFGVAHRDQFPESSIGGKAFADVSEAVEAFETHAAAKLTAVKDGRRERALARAIVLDAMRAIARTARAVQPPLPAWQNRLVMPRRTSDAALLTAADAFLKGVTGDPEPFIARGLPSTFVTDLQQAIDLLEQAMTARDKGREGVTTAQTGMTSALRRGTDAFTTLDAVVINVVGKDPVLAAGWIRNRRVIEGAPKGDAKSGSVDAAATKDSPDDPLKKVS